jgi:hypothetical protein
MKIDIEKISLQGKFQKCYEKIGNLNLVFWLELWFFNEFFNWISLILFNLTILEIFKIHECLRKPGQKPIIQLESFWEKP